MISKYIQSLLTVHRITGNVWLWEYSGDPKTNPSKTEMIQNPTFWRLVLEWSGLRMFETMAALAIVPTIQKQDF